MNRNKLRIGLIGFGKAGALAAKEILNDEECELAWVARREWKDTPASISAALARPGEQQGLPVTTGQMDAPDFFTRHPVDFIIDFSDRTGVEHYARAADHGIGVVSAVSHYDDEQIDRLRAMSARVPVLWSPNITVGINFIMAMGKVFRSLVPGADVQIVEEHFSAKKDVSGTALKIARHLDVDPQESISSVRAGGIVGRHEIIFGMPYQTIRLTHESVSRAVFGRGALLAAKWMRDLGPGFHSMESLITEFIRNEMLRSAETSR